MILRPLAGVAHRRAGGAEYLATHINDAASSADPNTLVVAPGDHIGASPLVSGLFHDEPTIEAMQRDGRRRHSVGNHEFDEGVDELLRMQNGGCHPVDGCQDGDAVRRRALPVPGRERDLRRHRRSTILRPTRSRRSAAPRSASSA